MFIKKKWSWGVYLRNRGLKKHRKILILNTTLLFYIFPWPFKARESGSTGNYSDHMRCFLDIIFHLKKIIVSPRFPHILFKNPWNVANNAGFSPDVYCAEQSHYRPIHVGIAVGKGGLSYDSLSIPALPTDLLLLPAHLLLSLSWHHPYKKIKQSFPQKNNTLGFFLQRKNEGQKERGKISNQL